MPTEELTPEVLAQNIEYCIMKHAMNAAIAKKNIEDRLQVIMNSIAKHKKDITELEIEAKELQEALQEFS